jgi:hypothetical protein
LRLLRTFYELLSIQKVLQKSTGLAGLLMKLKRPIVVFKKVALNFPPLEQGPGRQSGRLAPASRLRKVAMAEPLEKADTLENFWRILLACIQRQKTSPGG